MDLRKLEPLWGTCHLQDILGVGSYGVVYRAVQTTDGTSRACAVKHISIPKDAYEHHAYMDQLGTRDDEALKQFYAREIQSFVDEFQVQRLFSGKAHFVQVEDILIVPKDDMPGNDLFIRMELLHSIFHRFSEGMSGADKERETLRVGMDICSALVEMHARHYLHRDIKPQNILVSDDGEYKLGDFGSAHRLSGGASFLSVKGTLDYIAPDVFIGKMSDYSSDLYSLGLVLYQLLNHHRLPFTSSSSLPGAGDGNIRRLSGEPLPPPLEASPEVAAVILKACACKPEDRFRDASEMLQALKDIECLVSDRNIGALMKQAWSCIRDGMADDAKGLLAEVLTMYPQYAPAHTAKACIALGFRNESALSGAPFRYEDQPDWKLAMHYADPDQRKIYDSYVSRTDEKVAAQIHRYAHDCAVEMAVKPNLSRENLDADLNAYKKTCIWSAQNRADGSPRKNSQVNEDAFREAVMKKKTGRVSPQSLKTAASMFDSIGEKDYSQQCLNLVNLSVRRKIRQILLSILVVLLAAGTLFLYLNKSGSGKGRTSTQERNSASITVIPRQKLFVSSVSMAPLESPITSPIPEPEQNATPQSELNSSPGPDQNTTPEPELKSALEPDQYTTPEPELKSALEPDQNTTPEPKLKSALEPDQNTTPEPELKSALEPDQNTTPEPELKSALEPDQYTAPEPELKSALEPDQYTTPEPELKSALEPDQYTTPEPELKSALEPDQYTTPEPELKSALEPDQYTTPEPKLKSALELEHNTTPEPELNTSSEPELNTSPEPELNSSPEPELNTSPEPELNSSPEPELNASPEPELNSSPEPELNIFPEPELNTSPEPELNISPEPELNTSPEPIQTPTPTQAPNPEDLVAEGTALIDEKKYAEAIPFLELAASMGNAEAQYNVGNLYLWGNDIPRSYEKAFKYYQQAADQGYPEAITMVGNMYENGYGVPQSYVTAAVYYRQAAELGESTAMYNLGMAYYWGHGVPQTYATAIKYFRQAAEHGDSEALTMIGYMYQYGQGVKQSYNEALKYYRDGADKGSSSALNALGLTYEKGKGVTQNLKKAIEYYQASADLGYAVGQYNLGVMYIYGRGIAQSYDMAAKYWQMAAAQGYTDAQIGLGFIYWRSGQYDEALSLFEQAAAKGHPEAQYNLGVMYYMGQGVEKSVETAVMYWKQAAAQGYQAAIDALNSH